MTVICWDGISLAADKLNFGAINSKITKIRKINNELFGISGKTILSQLLWKWIEDGCKPDEIPEAQLNTDSHCTIVKITSSRRIFIYENLPTPWEHEGDVYAIGSGSELAIGAIEGGSGSKRAVEIAIKYNSLCGMGVDVLTFN